MAFTAIFAHRPARFLAIGGLNTAVGYALFAALLLLGASPFAAIAGSTAIGTLFNFASIGLVVFRNAEVLLLPRFLGVYMGQLVANGALLVALDWAGIGALAGQLLLVPLLATGTYLAMRRFVFMPAPASDPI